MKPYILFVKKFRKPLLILLVVMNLLALAGVLQLKISGDFKIFVPEVSANQDLLNDMNSLFPSSDQIIYMIQAEDGLTYSSYEKLASFQAYVESLSNVVRTHGPAPAVLTIGREKLSVSRENAGSLEKMMSYYEQLGELSPIISTDGNTYAMFTLFISEDFSTTDIHAIESRLKELGLSYNATGDSYMQLLVFDYILKILWFIPPIALFFVLLVFGLQLQSKKATILSILPAGLGALWTMGIIGWLGQEVSIITVLAPVFTIVIGSADGLHFISHVQDEEESGHDNISSLTKTLSIVGKPMIITTITSMVGFLALLTMNTGAIKDLAVFAAVGIFIAGVATWYVLPLILTGKTKLNKHLKRAPITFDFLKKTWGFPSIIIVFATLLVFGIGFLKIATEFNMLMVYKKSTSIYQSTVRIQEVNGGAIPVYIYGTTGQNPLSPEIADQMMILSDQLHKNDNVSKIISPYTVIQSLVPVFMPGQSGYPANSEAIKQISTQMLSMENSPVVDLLNMDQKAVKMIVFPKDLENKTLQEIKDDVARFNQTMISEGTDLTLQVTGVQYLMMDLNRSMFRNQLISTSVALLVVFLLLFLSLRKILPALISLIPISVTTLFLFGFLGLTGISLNILTTTIFSITIGVGIDYAIHYTSVFMHLKKEGLNTEEAVSEAYRYAARPIIANALGLSLGLSSLFLSPLQLHANVSILMWTTMAISVLLSLTVLPTSLRGIKNR
ncbi:MAG: MMPL family transporter [Clostridia bacterium]|nr:MMPL family transporter [Clostridia bacterium]